MRVASIRRADTGLEDHQDDAEERECEEHDILNEAGNAICAMEDRNLGVDLGYYINTPLM